MNSDEVYLILEGVVFPICGAGDDERVCLFTPGHRGRHGWYARADLEALEGGDTVRLTARIVRGVQ